MKRIEGDIQRGRLQKEVKNKVVVPKAEIGTQHIIVSLEQPKRVKKAGKVSAAQSADTPRLQTSGSGGEGKSPVDHAAAADEPEKPKKIGKKEKQNFRDKVTDLIVRPRFATPLDHGEWETEYEKDDLSIFVFMPAPGDEQEEAGNRIGASTHELVYANDEYFIINEKKITLDMRLSSDGTFAYDEELHTYDKEGNIVNKPQALDIYKIDDKKYFREWHDALSKKVADETILGTRVVTPDRYHEMMKLLHSLTPDDVASDSSEGQ